MRITAEAGGGPARRSEPARPVQEAKRSAHDANGPSPVLSAILRRYRPARRGPGGGRLVADQERDPDGPATTDGLDFEGHALRDLVDEEVAAELRVAGDERCFPAGGAAAERHSVLAVLQRVAGVDALDEVTGSEQEPEVARGGPHNLHRRGYSRAHLDQQAPDGELVLVVVGRAGLLHAHEPDRAGLNALAAPVERQLLADLQVAGLQHGAGHGPRERGRGPRGGRAA